MEHQEPVDEPGRPPGVPSPAGADPSCPGAPNGPTPRPARIWIDLDNTPHVPFFLPIIRRLQERGHDVLCTARDAFQVCELAETKGLRVTTIGRHYGRRMPAKAFGLFYRAVQLLPLARKHQPDLAVSHGARSQVLLSNLMRVPSAEFTDYEHFRMPAITRPRWLIVPEVLAQHVSHLGCNHIRTYPGLKEDVYVSAFKPHPALRAELGIRDGDLLATVRPPATEAHYHNPDSEPLFAQVMEHLLSSPDVRLILLPRNKRQEQHMAASHPRWFGNGRVVIPPRAVDGLNLLWHSDFLVSGGGTMNREAAALGVPAYSIFRGRQGAVDRHLVSTGRLTMIASAQDCRDKIVLERRHRPPTPHTHTSPALESIVRHLEQIVADGTR